MLSQAMRAKETVKHRIFSQQSRCSVRYQEVVMMKMTMRKRTEQS